MTPYVCDILVTSVGTDAIKTIPFLSRANIREITLVRLGTGTFTATFYSRAFTGTTAYLNQITNDGNSYCLLHKAAVNGLDLVRVGDVITVSGSSVGGYNTSHRVTAISGNNYVTDVAYSADSVGGQYVLAVPAAEQIAYRVYTVTPTTSSNVNSLNILYHNRDPLPNANAGYLHNIYLKLSDADTYRVVIVAEVPTVAIN